MSVDKPAREPIDWKTRSIDFAFSQGSGFILLIAAFYFGVPLLRAWRQEDMKEIVDTHRDTLEKVVSSWDRHLDQAVKAFQDDQNRDQREKDRLWQKLGVANQDEN
jgi:hypothetical protein